MSFERRLAKLENSLSPTEAVLSWLAEAHEYPTLPEYVASLLDASQDAWPLTRIAEQVEGLTRAAMKGKSQDAVKKAVRRQVGDAFFLLDVALRLNLAAEETLRGGRLRWACLSYQMRALTLEAELAEVTRRRQHAAARPSVSAVDAWRTGLAVSLTTIYTEEEARSEVERKYLAGRPVLFSWLVREWDDLRARLEGLASVADVLPELRGSGVPELALDERHARAAKGASVRASELTDQARVAALDMLGEATQAVAIAGRRLRSTISRAADDGASDDGNSASVRDTEAVTSERVQWVQS